VQQLTDDENAHGSVQYGVTGLTPLFNKVHALSMVHADFASFKSAPYGWPQVISDGVEELLHTDSVVLPCALLVRIPILIL
jgi:hypothetical protein